MDKTAVKPPGQHPLDPYRQDIDPVGFALERIQTMLLWVDEHRASFEKYRKSDPVNAECELCSLKNVTEQAVLYSQRLSELLLAGCSINPEKRLPKGLGGALWLRFTEACFESLQRPPIDSRSAAEPQ